MSAALVLLLLLAPADEGVDTLVVCPVEFRQALGPWLKHREAQGHKLRVLSNMKSAEELRAEIRAAAGQSKVHNLVLIGDAEPEMGMRDEVRKRCIPTHYAKAVVDVKFGSEPEIATDNWFADLDDDRVPDLTVGRITADSPAELSLMVEKILDYETSTDFGSWRRQIHFVAGLGGFGAMTDAIMEAAAKSLISEGVPAPYLTTMTYGSWQSPYCPDPRAFNRVTMDRLNEGCLFWVYIGHGQQRAVDEVRVPSGQFPILSVRDVPRLTCRRGAPIACFLACHSGAFDKSRDCLGEELLRKPGGPVAILCGSRVTMPYAMSVMGSELLRECFTEHAVTLGDAMLGAKRRMMSKDDLSRHRRSLDAMASAMSPTANELDAERAEHLDLFNILGDPLLRIAYPETMTVEVAPTAAPGSKLEISGNSPLEGSLTVELSVRRDKLTFKPPRRAKYDPLALEAYSEVYKKANDPRWAHVQLNVPKGPFKTELMVPAEARGVGHVRVFVESVGGCATGAADLKIEAPQTEQSATN